MLQYNTKKSALPMPEYGRNVQQMVDHCLTLESRDERNACARAIVDTICRLNPQLRTNPEWRAKLWDHLAIMSDFKLDIDYPSEPVTPETLTSRPAKVEIPQHRIPKRVYGANILKMIEAAKAMDPADPDREMLVMLLANHMKKLLLSETPRLPPTPAYSPTWHNSRKATFCLTPTKPACANTKCCRPPARTKRSVAAAD